VASTCDRSDASAFTNAQARRTEVTLAAYAGHEEPARAALTDRDPTVRAAALSALDRLSTLTTTDLSLALSDVDLRVRRRACEIAALLPAITDASLDIDNALLRYLRTGDETMAELSAWSLGERHQEQNLSEDEAEHHTSPFESANETTEQTTKETGHDPSSADLKPTRFFPPNLEEIVQALSETVYHHPDALVREAAVAALGCIGAPEAKDAILHAIGDKATVRRRAVIALAAFEGDDVEMALAEATGDRDWQVRQAAEDLLA
jgi:HEAT repeat protein